MTETVFFKLSKTDKLSAEQIAEIRNAKKIAEKEVSAEGFYNYEQLVKMLENTENHPGQTPLQKRRNRIQ